MDDVEFYEKQVKFQENLGKIQQERSALEREFYQMTQADKNVKPLQTSDLRTHWKEICERERKARERNEKLLRDFSDMEYRISKIKVQTDQLEETKKKYEEELSRVYPDWKHEMDMTKAEQQLKDAGYEVTASNNHSLPSLGALDLSFVPNSSSPHHANVVAAQAPLFKLVPYDANDSFQATVQPTRHSNAVKNERPESTNKAELLDRLVSSERNKGKSKTSLLANVPPLDLPTERDSIISTERNQLKTNVGKLPNQGELKPNASPEQQNNLRETPTKASSPTPVTPNHRYSSSASVVQRVEINTTKPDISLSASISTSGQSDVSTISGFSEVVPPSIPEVPIGELTSHETAEKPSLNPTIEVSPKRSTSPANVHNITSPKITVPIEIPRHSLDSAPSESATTETSHKTLPLTSSAVYQNMLKSNEFSSTLGMSKYLDDDDDDDQDDIEKIVSPKSVAARFSEEDRSSRAEDSRIKTTPELEVKTALQPSSEASSSVKDQYIPSSYPPAKIKAPWDTDSEEEDSFDSREVARVKKLDDDDFDFFD